MSLPKLILIPGLGADGRFFEPQRVLPASIEVAEWFVPESPKESLRHYASRMAERIGRQPDAYIGGNSMGAMAALEISTQIEAKGVFMIGGCSSWRQISSLFRAILKAGAAMPRSFVRPSLLFGPAALKFMEGLNLEQRSLMMHMLREQPSFTLQWSCRAVLEWECCQTEPSAPVYRIHGMRDEIIPAKNMAPDEWIVDGHHLISLARSRQVNAFIAARLGSALPGMPGSSEGARI